MSLNVCDYEPCGAFQSALQTLIVIPAGIPSFHLVVISKGTPLKTYYVPLTYCPFCGTRVEEEWIEPLLPGHRS